MRLQSSHDVQVMKSGDEQLGNSLPKEESLPILKAMESGLAYILGHSHAKAKKSSSIVRQVAIDIACAFLSMNRRDPDVVLNVPHTSLLEVDALWH